MQRQSSWQERIKRKKLVPICWEQQWQDNRNSKKTFPIWDACEGKNNNNKKSTSNYCLSQFINLEKDSWQNVYSVFIQCILPNGNLIMFDTASNYPMKIFAYERNKCFNFLQVSWTNSVCQRMRCAFLFCCSDFKLGWFTLEENVSIRERA